MGSTTRGEPFARMPRTLRTVVKLWSVDRSQHADELRRLAHKLAGGAVTLGLHHLSALAGQAEDATLCGAPDAPARLTGGEVSL